MGKSSNNGAARVGPPKTPTPEAPASEAVKKMNAARTVVIELPVAAQLIGNSHTQGWGGSAYRPDQKLSDREARALQHVLQACHAKTPVGRGSPGVCVTNEGNAIKLILNKIADGLGI